MACWSAKLVGAAFRRARDPSLTADQKIAGLSHGDGALKEARARSKALADRLYPVPPAVHGFYDPAGFMDRAFISGQWKRVERRAFERFLGVIIARDGLLAGELHD